MRKTIALLLVLLCMVPCLGYAEDFILPLEPVEPVVPVEIEETEAPEAPEEPLTERVFLPTGVWVRSMEGVWGFQLLESVTLNETQRAALGISNFSHESNLLRAGTSLTEEQVALLYPGAGELLARPVFLPQIEQFELTGEWFFGDDGVLRYSHSQRDELLTVDEVFEALRDPEISVRPETGAEEKVIYLTIDDAPSPLTMDLLAMLDQLDVQATFFVVGAYVRTMPVYLRAIYEQGHVLANHSYTHDAKILASSFSACLNDFRRTERAVADALGFELAMPILRIPYGASTVPASYRTWLQDEGYVWIDWNALNGDTEAAVKSDADALQRAISTASRTDGDVVLLVHDNKKRTIRTLPALVEHFRALGYTFRALDFDTLTDMPNVRMGMPRTKP